MPYGSGAISALSLLRIRPTKSWASPFGICRCSISRVPSREPICGATQKGDRNSRMSSVNGRFWPVEHVSQAHRKGLTKLK